MRGKKPRLRERNPSSKVDATMKEHFRVFATKKTAAVSSLLFVTLLLLFGSVAAVRRMGPAQSGVLAIRNPAIGGAMMANDKASEGRVDRGLYFSA